MRYINVTELKKHLRRYVRLAEAGEEIVILNRKQAIARLIQFSADEQELLLVAEGSMRLPKCPIDVDKLLRIPTGRVFGNEAVQVLLDERESGQ